MALSALLLLLPLLLNVPKIPDDAVQRDVDAVVQAIERVNVWKDPRKTLEPLESQLTEAQRALLKRHWELETLQARKPGSPAQLDLQLFAQALQALVGMDEANRQVKLRMRALQAWARGEDWEHIAEAEETQPEELTQQESDTKPEELTQTQQVKEESTQTQQAAEVEKMESDPIKPEVKVNARGEVEVKNANMPAGGRMVVRNAQDEQGNPEVIVTFVKDAGASAEHSGNAAAKENATEQNLPSANDSVIEHVRQDNASDVSKPELGRLSELLLHPKSLNNDEFGRPETVTSRTQTVPTGSIQSGTESTTSGVEPTMSETESVLSKTESLTSETKATGSDSSSADEEKEDEEDLSSPSEAEEEEADAEEAEEEPAPTALLIRMGPQQVGGLFGDAARQQQQQDVSSFPEEEEEQEQARVQPSGGSWLFGGNPLGSVFRMLFGRKKRDTEMQRNAVRTISDGRTVRTQEKHIAFGGPFADFSGNIDLLSMILGGGGGGEQQQQQQTEDLISENKALPEEPIKPEEPKVQQSDITTEAKMEEDPKRAEIKQYLERYVAESDGKLKETKLAYVWYAEQLYWTAKWIELLENRVSGVSPELIQQFLFSSTGLAGYKELKSELDQCGAKLDTLKQWLGEYYRK